MEQPERIKILIVEDNPVEAKLMGKILSSSPSPSFAPSHADTLETALQTLDAEKFKAILLDLTLPDSEGFQTFEKIEAKADDTAIIVLTGVADDQLAMDALRKGAQDYVVKGDVHPRVLIHGIRYAIERKKIEEQLRKVNSELKETRLQLIQAAKMEVVGRLAAGVAHEVKNPLAILRMGLNYYEGHQKELSEEALYILKTMNEAISRADSVIKEMLDFSSLKELNIVEQDIRSMIEKVQLLLKYDLTKKGIRLETSFSEEVVSVKVDANRIEQVFVNLISNAAESFNGKGEIRIKVSTKKLVIGDPATGYRQSDFFLPGESAAVVEICDNGPGIPDEIVDKIFDPFFTTKRDTGGTGLGLCIVKNIIEMHHGMIMIGKNEGGGTKVTLYLKQ